MTASRKEMLLNALKNATTGNSQAVRVRDTTQNAEIRELAIAVHYIGFAVAEAMQALTESEEYHVNDLPL